MQNRNDKTLLPLLCHFGFRWQILFATVGVEGLGTERFYSAGFLGMAIMQLGEVIIFIFHQ